MKRLIADMYDIIPYDGSSYPAGFLVHNIEDTFTNDNITKIKYTTDIDKTYYFEQPYENLEMSLLAQKEDLINMSTDRWVKAFAQALRDEKVQSTQSKDYKLKKKAEINVKDLPKIIWNEEEYRVLFNKNGKAEILNNFGNHVLTLEDTYTIKQVNTQLADQEIVPEDYRQDELDMVIQKSPDTELYKDTHSILSANKDLIGTTETQAEHYNQPHYGADPNYLQDDYSDIELEDEDIEQFQEGVCPYCGQPTLQLVNDKDELWVFVCDECKTEYTVEPEQGDIRIKSIASFDKTAEDIISEDILIKNKTLFLSEMEKKSYDTSMIDSVNIEYEFEDTTYEVNIIIKDDYITNIIAYVDNQATELPEEVYNAVIEDINECNID